MRKVTIIGHFGGEKTYLDGQTIKTKTIANILTDKYGNQNVFCIDTVNAQKFIFKFIFQAPFVLHNTENIIILPAQNGVKIIVPILSFFNRFYKRKIHYCVIGGWLPSLLKNKKNLKKQLFKFDGIYVETSTLKKSLEKLGFLNVVTMPNCKELTILREDELVYSSTEPYKLCTFSRVNKKKGIEDAVEAVIRINKTNSRIIFSLDIFGQIDPNELEWFKNLQKNFPEYIAYKGCVDFDKSVEVLKNYFALLFPTHYFTEGIPGTILDAYASGLPVICSKWESFSDLIDNGKTGFGYEFANIESLIAVLSSIANDSNKILNLKSNCLKKAKNYQPFNVIKLLNIN